MPDPIPIPSRCAPALRQVRAWLGALPTGLALVACTEPVCTLELRVDVRPRGEQQIAVGEGFMASVALSSCGGGEKLSDAFTWSAGDTLVVRVEPATDPATSRITGRSPGSTSVGVAGARYGRVGVIPVVVR